MIKAAEATVTRDVDFSALGARWRALEARADGSFFTSWSWVGCLIAERFDAPLLLQVRQDGRDVALALFNRRRSAAWLHETGVAARDAVFVEHNGLLTERGLTLQPAWLRNVGARVVFSGVGAPIRDVALGRMVVSHQERPAPFVDLEGIRRDGAAYLDRLSANTRYQVRRSTRLYGAVTVRRAETVADAVAWLDDLAALHQVTWNGRGKPGAFADPDFTRFHRALIAEALPRDEIDLLHITAGAVTVGYLYNFRWRGRVMSYQSGFAYAEAGSHRKPGLTCHVAAIEAALRDGVDIYDFLAGEDRYKASLATDGATMHWIEVAPAWLWTAYQAVRLGRRALRWTGH